MHRLSFVQEQDDNGEAREAAWAAFWAVMGPALVDLHRDGLLETSLDECADLGRSRLDRFGYTSADVRRWLRRQGRAIHPVGRLPNRILDEYEVAMGHRPTQDISSWRVN